MNQPLFSRLKKLFIFNRKIWTNSINCLRDLEVLGLDDVGLISKTDISLNLPNLRVFSCTRSDNDHNLSLNCPKLEKLVKNDDFLSIVHPESIKELHLYHKEDFLFDAVNCEYLYLEIGHFDQNILLKLKKLKQLYVTRKDFESLTSFVRQKRTLNRTNLKIYHLNLLSDSFTNLDHFGETYRYYHRLNSNTIQFYGPNYSNLPNKVYFIDIVDYNVVENYFCANPNQIVRGIIEKLVYLNLLILSDQIRDVNQFIGILKDRRYLNQVKIKAKFMPQTFFDEILSENCSIIENLFLENTNQLNFDFLLKFKELQCFHTEQQLTSDLILKMFDKFELLESLEFHYESSDVEIELQLRKKFKIRLDGVRAVFDNLEDLMSHLEINHHKTPFSLDDCLDNFLFNS